MAEAGIRQQQAGMQAGLPEGLRVWQGHEWRAWESLRLKGTQSKLPINSEFRQLGSGWKGIDEESEKVGHARGQAQRSRQGGHLVVQLREDQACALGSADATWL